MKTVSEIKDDLRALRDDMFRSGENVDAKLVASYLDRLLLSVEDLSQSLESLEAEVDTVSSCCEAGEAKPMGAECSCPCCCAPMEKPKAKPKKAAKKAKKPAKKKGRR